MYLLDTDIVSYAIKNRPPQLYDKLAGIDPNDIAISAIVHSELLYGAVKSGRESYYMALIYDFMRLTKRLDWPDSAAEHMARIRHYLTSAGKPIGTIDMQIAAHALALDCTLVTNNTKHFSQIKNLKIENWVL